MKVWTRLLLVWLLAALLVALPGSSSPGMASALQQGDGGSQKARNMLQKLTPEERVGQLFLVTFPGNTFDENSQIFDLIANYHVGGVMLLRSNDNFTTADNLPAQVYALNNLLQNSEVKAAQRKIVNSNTGVSFSPQYIPLFIGVSQEGDGYPNDQILSGLTPLPDLMSIGATWDPNQAKQVGAVMGKELSALGINLYIGPSLDVLDSPQIDSGEDLGVRTFGGDPYWVGKMGQQYISGLHQGSDNRLAVIAKNFPGRGSSDRSPEEEIATVRKSLEQLKQIELAPFFAVTGNAPSPDMATDGLLVSHIRYQGFQGNIRATTRPVSSDATALDQILKIQQFSTWRDQGGLMVSDNLGSQAIRRFYDPTGNAFDQVLARTAAREAFFAGNDLLYLDHFIATNDPDSYTTITHTIQYFVQKYREDAAFAQRVDASVLRILTLKYRLYPDFDPTSVTPPVDSLNNIGQSQDVTSKVALAGVTLISPDAIDLPNSLPRPPEARERILFLTDVQPGKQCSTCSETVTLPVDALQSAVLRLYGPRAGGQISQNGMSSYSFMDLWKYINGYTTGNNEPPTIENDLKLANWVVVSILKPNPTQLESQAFRRLLSERPDLLRNKKIVVFAFNAPYYLDATDISKLTAYYALYSKTAPFVDVAARVLFQEQSPTASLPVSVPGVGYDLIYATSPDPTQVIPLVIDNTAPVPVPTKATQEPTPAPAFRVGDVIPLRTGVIVDHNRNQVPDGTPVHFVFSVISESAGSSVSQVDTQTVDGVARWMYRIERPGLLEIHAMSDPGAQTNLLRLDITSGASAGVTMVPPTARPTETLVPTPTVTITPTITPSPTETVVPPPTMHFQDWFFALLIVLAGAVGVSWFGVRQAIARWGLRWALCGVIGGMIFYNYLALKLPGSQELLKQSGTMGILLVTFIGVLVGWGVGLTWRQLSSPTPAPRPTGERSGDRPATGPKSQSG